ncbi:MAG: hypothetical protein AB7U75_14740 [Hyphomicrobiaceae bacterium]
MTFTREQIEAVDLGTRIAYSIDGVSFSEATEVVEITARGEDVHGNLFVCGYRKFGPTSRISFSVKENNATDFRLTRIEV